MSGKLQGMHVKELKTWDELIALLQISTAPSVEAVGEQSGQDELRPFSA